MKPVIQPFDSGWIYILDLSFKLISLLVIWSYNCNNAAKKNVTHLGSSIAQAFDQHSMLSLNEYLNLESEGPINTEKQVVVQKDLHKVYVHVKNHITMYETVNLEDTINVTLSNVTDHDTSPFLPTFHIMV